MRAIDTAVHRASAGKGKRRYSQPGGLKEISGVGLHSPAETIAVEALQRTLLICARSFINGKDLIMKRACVFFSLISVVLLSEAPAQQLTTRVGFGVSLNPVALVNLSSASALFLPVGLTDIYIPIQIGNNFRLEPDAGYLSMSTETKYPQTTYSPAYSSNSSNSMTRIGLGAFYVMPVDTSFRSYVGPRFGLLFTSSESSSTYPGSTNTSSDETDFYLGLAAGGEYMLSTHFSVGCEVQFNYVNLGEPSVSPAQPTSSTQSGHMVTNNALMFLRWYF